MERPVCVVIIDLAMHATPERLRMGKEEAKKKKEKNEQ